MVAGIGPARGIDFEPTPLHRMIGLADLIVSGRVVEAGEETFHFEVERLLAGELAERRVEVRGRTPWPRGSARPAPYTPGQSFVLFLQADLDTVDGAPWRIPGVGGAGELPVVGGHVYFPQVSIAFLERRTVWLHGVDVEASNWCLSDFLAAVAGYRECFTWTQLEAEPSAPRPERTCDEAALAEYRARSRMHEYLTAKTLAERPGD